MCTCVIYENPSHNSMWGSAGGGLRPPEMCTCVIFEKIANLFLKMCTCVIFENV